MAKRSAGLLVFRSDLGELEVFLVHPGGPFWARKDEHAWSIPKGEIGEGEDGLTAAVREFAEETGVMPAEATVAEAVALQPVRQPGGKIVEAWAVRGDIDAAAVHSNSFVMEWPPGSGRTQEYPEVDRGEWFTLEQAATKILKGQAGLLGQLERLVSA